MPLKINPRILTRKDIWREAEALRDSFPRSCGDLPVDVLALAEFDLKLEIRVAPLRELEQEALLFSDLSTIVLDHDAFMSPRQNRLRFSVAHEVGHLRLHAKIFQRLAFDSVDDWIRKVQAIPLVDYQRIEWQAYEFAGRLLVPRASLEAAFEEGVEMARREGYTHLDKEAVLEFVAKSICEDFGVSQQVIAKRIRSEGLFAQLPGNDSATH